MNVHAARVSCATRRSTVALTAVTFAIVTLPAHAVLLYDVDFESPVHTLGAPPTVGQEAAPRKTVTHINFGTPTIAQAAGVLDGQFLRLQTSGGTYQQVSFGLGDLDGGFTEQYPAYHFTTDLVVHHLDDTMTYFVDGPTAHKLIFTPSGGLLAFVWGPEGYEEPIGVYEFGARVSLDILVDRDIERWTIRVDDDVVFTDDYPIYHWGGMRMMRPSLSGPGMVDIDNVRIWGLPEPGSLLLLVAGAVGLATRRRRRL